MRNEESKEGAPFHEVWPSSEKEGWWEIRWPGQKSMLFYHIRNVGQPFYLINP